MNMTPQDAISLGQDALAVAGLVAAPMLLAALIVGLVISVMQAATQVNEQTLSFIPKLVAVFAALLITGPWMISMMTDFMQRVFQNIAMIGI
jgi:flagellar biosynthetic protein FliQ